MQRQNTQIHTENWQLLRTPVDSCTSCRECAQQHNKQEGAVMSSPLREYLWQTGKSMRGTALEIGVEPHLFNSYAHGKRPNQRNAMRVALALGLDVRTLWPNYDQLRRY
jgi:hypothetical protein